MPPNRHARLPPVRYSVDPARQRWLLRNRSGPSQSPVLVGSIPLLSLRNRGILVCHSSGSASPQNQCPCYLPSAHGHCRGCPAGHSCGYAPRRASLCSTCHSHPRMRTTSMMLHQISRCRYPPLSKKSLSTWKGPLTSCMQNIQLTL